MDIKNPERMQRLKEKLSNLGKESNICLIYDIDADGMSSGSLIKHAFEKMGLGFKLELTDITRKAVLSEENQKKIKNAQIDCIVATDMSFPGFKMLEDCRKLTQEGINFIVFDHHEYEPSMQGDNSLLIHPVDIFGEEHSAMCASKLVYDILGKFVPLSEYDWIKCIGMIGDMNFLRYPEEVNEIIRKYDTKAAPISSNDDYFQSKLGRLSQLVNLPMVIGTNESLTDMFKAYSESRSLDELSENLGKKHVKEVDDQIAHYTGDFENLAVKTGDIYFLQLDSKYILGSAVSSIISFKKKDNTFIVYQKKGDSVIVSSRRQDHKYSMRDLMKLSVNGLQNANGGGHIPAAGASIMAQDWEIFKQHLLDNYAKAKVDA